MAFIVTGLVAGGIGALGSLGAAAIGSSAASDAADKQAAAANQANQLQAQMFQQQQANQQPWLQAGRGALTQMQDPYFQQNFSQSDFQADPGYQFRLQQGMDAIQRSAAARGGLGTTGTMKSLNDYAQGQASQEYQNAYNRFTNNQTNRFNRLASLSGMGQTANAENAQAGMNYANNAGQNMMGAANAAGAAGMASANGYANALSGLGNSANTWMGLTMLNRGSQPAEPFTPMDYSNAKTGNPAGPTLPDGSYASGDYIGPGAGAGLSTAGQAYPSALAVG